MTSADLASDSAWQRTMNKLREKPPALSPIPRFAERIKSELGPDGADIWKPLCDKRLAMGIRPASLWTVISLQNFREPEDNSPFTYSEVQGVRDTTPVERTVDWSEQFVEWMDTRHRFTRMEKDGPAFILAIFRPGGRRADADVLANTAAGLDFDGLTRGQAEQVLYRAAVLGLDIAFVIYSTYSHSPENGIHLRIVFPYVKPVSVEEHARIYAALLDYFDGLADSSSRNPSRIHYFPTLGHGPEALLNFQIYTERDADSILQSRPSEPSAAMGQVEQLIHDGMAPQFDADRSRAMASVICSLIGQGNSNDEIARILSDPANGISERALEIGSTRLREDIARLRRKLSGQVGASSVGLITQSLDKIEPQSVSWLWRGHFPRGKLALVVGHPGLGKSQVLASISASVTAGTPFPDGSPNSSHGGVLIITVEDDAADTLRPRYEAAGADLSRAHFVKAVRQTAATERTFDLRLDLAALEQAILAIRDVGVVLIDPLTSFIPDINPNNTVEVRRVLDPLNQLAARLGVAVIGVLHMNKGERARAIEKPSGSMAFVAAARAAFLVEADRDNPDRRYFVPLKFNIAKMPPGLAFGVVGVTLPNGIETSKVVWEGTPVTGVSADDLVRGDEETEQRSALGEACEFLKRELQGKALSYKEIEAAAELAGHSMRTVRRAQKKLGIKPHKDGARGAWMWSVPSSPAQGGQDDQES